MHEKKDMHEKFLVYTAVKKFEKKYATFFFNCKEVAHFAGISSCSYNLVSYVFLGHKVLLIIKTFSNRKLMIPLLKLAVFNAEKKFSFLTVEENLNR